MTIGGETMNPNRTMLVVALAVVTLIAVATVEIHSQADESVSHLRNISLPESQPPSDQIGPPPGTDQGLSALSVNLEKSESPPGWKVTDDGGYIVSPIRPNDPIGRNDVLTSCLGASSSGVGILTGASSEYNEPKVFDSDLFTEPGGPSASSTVVQVSSASVERSDLARYSSLALSPCLSLWKQAPFLDVPQAPVYDAFVAPRVAGVQAIGFHFRYQLGGSGSPTTQFYGDLIVAGSGRLEGAIKYLSGYTIGFGGPGRSPGRTEQQLTTGFLTRMAAAAR